MQQHQLTWNTEETVEPLGTLPAALLDPVQEAQPRLRSGSLVDAVVPLGRQCEALTTLADRKRRGQFFTPPGIAAFMASQFRCIPGHARLLDAGAGVGILTAAVCDRILAEGAPRQVQATLYENYPPALAFLIRGMDMCQRAMTAHGHDFSYTIHETDFILDNEEAVRPQKSLFTSQRDRQFDLAILNPPYYKLRRAAPQVVAMEPVVHGQPNIYALFMAMAAALLDDGGQLVALTPRSYCNGLYFRSFRRWLFHRMQPGAIHIFGSRTDAFQEDKVLQENIILTWDRRKLPPTTVRLTRSHGRELSSGQLDVCDVPYAQIVDDSHGQTTIRIPEQAPDSEIAAYVDRWSDTFASLGFAISTGPVVSFRARDLLREAVDLGRDAAPLLWMHNVKPFEVTWPRSVRGKAQWIEVSERSAKLLLPTKNYVLLKRFSAKEERRRITAGVLIADAFPHRQVGIENHLNYISRPNGDLTVDEMYGLAGLFNSKLMDRYVRTIRYPLNKEGRAV